MLLYFMKKLPKINTKIQRNFLVGFILLILFFAGFFHFFIKEQDKTISKHHISYTEKADATIETLLGQARLHNEMIVEKIVKLLKTKDKEKIVETFMEIERKEARAGILLDNDILLAVDMDGEVIARSPLIKGERVKVKEGGNIKDDWTPSLGFKQAFENARAGNTDVRKIIYNRDFLRREGYDFWEADGMGLTVMTPIIYEYKDEGGERQKEQLGVLIGITFVNENVPVVLGLKAVTDVSFTAILPSGEIIGSIFSPESIEKISPSPEMIELAEQKAIEKRAKMLSPEGLVKTTEMFILEDFTIEEINLTHADGTTAYYRVLYWLELDPDGNFVSLRGIAMEIDRYIEQKNFLVQLILLVILFQLLIFFYFYLILNKTISGPITSFVNQLKDKKEDQKIKISKHYQEFKELENAFNASFEKVKDAQDVLEIKVKARTRQLKELSDSLEEQVNQKTEALQEEVNKLKRHMKVATGRELKMIELKKEIKSLKDKLKDR